MTIQADLICDADIGPGSWLRRRTSWMTRLRPSMKIRRRQLREMRGLEAAGLLAAQCAHDINNHLMAIEWFVELALAKTYDDAAREPVEEIRRSVDRAGRLTSRLLTLSCQPGYRLERHSLSEIVRGLDSTLRALLGSDVVLTLDLDPDLTSVLVERCATEQVIINMAINARQAMPRGGELTIRTGSHEASRESDHGGRTAGEVLLTVSDNGEGMDATTKRRLFEPWFTTKRCTAGTGLGLSTAQAVVSGAGGRISVSSEPGRGTTFTISFPIVNEQDGRAETSAR